MWVERWHPHNECRRLFVQNVGPKIPLLCVVLIRHNKTCCGKSFQRAGFNPVLPSCPLWILQKYFLFTSSSDTFKGYLRANPSPEKTVSARFKAFLHPDYFGVAWGLNPLFEVWVSELAGWLAGWLATPAGFLMHHSFSSLAKVRTYARHSRIQCSFKKVYESTMSALVIS